MKNNPNKGLLFLYNTRLGRIFLKLIFINSFVSKVVGWFMDTKLSCVMIKKFIKSNNIDMSEYEDKKYTSFNDFFTRKVKVEKRVFDDNKNSLSSPCDSYVTHYKITDDLLFNVKNSLYSLSSILDDDKLAKKYANGDLIIFRLTPSNYHRYHYFDDGKMLYNKKIKGKFHTVNPIVYDKYEVFKENTREYSVLKTKRFGKVIYMQVGALLVGKINNYNKKSFKMKEEAGYFSYGGSTCILIFEKDTIKINRNILNKSKKNIEVNVKYGEKIGEIKK
ncbi:MAG: phosphatidylserine decarboxylase [Tenericutes bacterium]|nr:phosphatidylserine decarboxylase [Mycoplasmatota bacterium]